MANKIERIVEKKGKKLRRKKLRIKKEKGREKIRIEV